MEALRKNDKILAVIAATIGHSIWGFSYLFTRMGLQVASPDIFLSVRFSIAFIITNIMLLTGKFKVSLKGKPLGLILLLGVMEPVYFYFESYGILYTNATYSGVVLSIVPIACIVLAAIFLKEYPTKKQLIFCTLPIIGVIIITVSGSSMGVVTPFGMFLLICTLLASAIYRTLNKKTAEAYTPFERTYIILGISALVFLSKCIISPSVTIDQYAEAFSHWNFVVPVLVSSALCSVLCYTIVNYAAGKMSVMTLSIYGTLTTIVSMFAGVIFLHEPFSAASIFGSVLIIFGIWQVTKASPEVAQKSEKAEESEEPSNLNS